MRRFALLALVLLMTVWRAGALARTVRAPSPGRLDQSVAGRGRPATAGEAPARQGNWQRISIPFAGEPTTPYLVADGSGGFLVSWIDRKTSTVNLAAFRGGRWFQPRMIAGGKQLAINRASFPVLADGPRGQLAAAWMERNDHGTIVRIARSANDGASWSAPRTPHPTDVVSQFGFVSLAAGRDGVLHAVWLDGRGLEGGVEGEGDMQLRYAAFLPGGKEGSDVLLDPRVCDCCQTAIAVADSGPVVAYRDRSPKEVRDISVVRWTGSGWSAPATVGADGWQLRGCPVNGPQLDARGDEVVLAWFTGAKDEPRVRVAFSGDGGATFAAPLRVDGGSPTGRVDVGLTGDGSAIVTWVEQGSDAASVMARRVTRDGRLDPPSSLGTVPTASISGFPRMAVSDDNVAVAWSTERSIEMATTKVSE